MYVLYVCMGNAQPIILSSEQLSLEQLSPDKNKIEPEIITSGEPYPQIYF
jgi:hypothetical protein